MELPEGVQAVRKANRTYYYWAPKRGTTEAGPRIALGWDAEHPDFWRKLREARGAVRGAKTFDALITAYKASAEFAKLRPATQTDYSRYLDVLSIKSGDRAVATMTRRNVYQLRDDMSDRPVAANHMLSVLQTLIEWGVPRDFREDNPVIGVIRIDVDGNGATPWPEDGYACTLKHAPTDLRRAAFLGRATGQRASDLVRMKGGHLQADGMTVWIGKLRERKHFVPLTAPEIAEIRSWGVTELDHFLKSTREHSYSATHLNSRWNRWRDSDAAKPIADLNMTLHGLRATKIFDMHRQNVSSMNIADEIGMSVPMVSRYLRFSDKTKAARESRDRRETARTSGGRI